MTKKRRLLAFIGVVAFVDLTLALAVELDYSDLPITTLLAYLFAQVAIIAVWTALSMQNWPNQNSLRAT